MKCKTLHTKLIFFIDGDLPPKEMKAITQHLANCQECAAFANDMQKTFGVLASEKSQEVNPFFYTRVKARLENLESKVFIPKTISVWNQVLQPAAFSILLIAGIYMGFKIGQTSSTSKSPAISETEIIPYLNEMPSETIENFLMQ